MDHLGDQRGVAGGGERFRDALLTVGGVSRVLERPPSHGDGLRAVQGGVHAHPGVQQCVVGDDLERGARSVLAFQSPVEPAWNIRHGQHFPRRRPDRYQGSGFTLSDHGVDRGLLHRHVDGEGDVLAGTAFDSADHRRILRLPFRRRPLVDDVDHRGRRPREPILLRPLDAALPHRVALLVGGAELRRVLSGGGADLPDDHLD